MGQYYIVLNIDKGIQLYTNGIKLMNICWRYNSNYHALSLLLNSYWKDSRVVLAGDYAGDEPLLEKNLYFIHEEESPLLRYNGGFSFDTFSEYSEVPEGEADVLNGDIDALHEVSFFYSLDKQEYIHLGEYFRDKEDMTPHPIGIFLASESGGGGDYYGDDSHWTGRFYKDRVGITKIRPTGMKDITKSFYFTDG